MAKYLIVDDDPAGRRLTEHFLSPYGECHGALDGQEAIQAFRQALDEGKPFDLICLDIMMPGTSGHEVLCAIRQIEAEHGILGSDCTKVVMLTALNDPKHCIRAFGEGCESYITKPIREQRLLAEVRSLLGELRRQNRPAGDAGRAGQDSQSRPAARQAASPRPAAATSRPVRRFLIVDDDRLCRELLKDILTQYGTCDFAYDGQEALEAIRLAIEENDPYDMVCLDIMMPGTNGHQALEAIRRTELEHGIYGSDGVKVIMTTALRDSQHCLKAFHEGCEAYLTKPVRRSELLARMHELGVYVEQEAGQP